MELDATSARELLDATYNAWSRGDVDAVLAQYTDDLTFWSNLGGADGEPITIVGKEAFAKFVRELADTLEGASAMDHFSFADGIARATIEHYIRHKKTRLAMTGSYRQVTMFRDGKIARVEQYHDAARTAAFWRLVERETASS